VSGTRVTLERLPRHRFFQPRPAAPLIGSAAMSNEALTMAGRVARRYAKHAVGAAAGVSMGLGIVGAMQSCLMFATALPPTVGAHEEAMLYKGFNEATQFRYDVDQSSLERQVVVAAAGAAALGAARPAIRRLG
jgi:hypothetical protein